MASESKKVQWILSARYIVPVVPEGEFENHSLIIDEGKIIDLLPTNKVNELYHADPENHLDLSSHVLLPGFINMHTHSAMTLARSIVDGVDLQTWLEKYIWPVEREFVSPEFCRAGVEKACTEMIRSGTTCFNDMYFHPEITAAVADHCGMRAAVGIPVINVATNWAATPQIAIEKFRELHEQYKGHERIQVSISPHAPYTVTDELFLECEKISKETNCLVHTHLHETPFEVNTPDERPFNRLEKLGVINERLIAVHMTELTEEEIQKLEETKIAALVHCPESNLKLGSGICPVSSLGNINVCIGTDGASSNDDLDIIGETRTAYLVDNYRSQVKLGGLDKSKTSSDWIKMMTINAAKALRISDKVGSLEKGKEADVVAIKVNALPVYNIQNTLVMSGTNPVTDVWVAGRSLMRAGVLADFDEDAVNQTAIEWGEKIKKSREAQAE